MMMVQAIGFDKAFEAAGMDSHATHRGLAYRQYFRNGYGVSILTGDQSDDRSWQEYCHNGRPEQGEELLWEVAVLHRETHSIKFAMCYDTDITDDLIRLQTVPEVLTLVQRVKNLDITGKEVK